MTKPKERPDGVGHSEWKNRHLVSAKLTGPLYADLMVYCRKHNFSVNSALRTILTEFFK